MRSASQGWGRLPAALAAAAAAILANTLVLRTADVFGVATAKGGLLRLITQGAAVVLGQEPTEAVLGARVQAAVVHPGVQTAFHLGVGLLMGLAYAFAFEPLALRRPWTSGFVCGALVWLVNAFLVLPLTGEGVAGVAHLTSLGIIWFAAAHFLFFVGLAVLYARLRRVAQMRKSEHSSATNGTPAAR